MILIDHLSIFEKTIDLTEAKENCKKFANSILTCNIQSANPNFETTKDLIFELEFPKIVNLVEIWQPKLSMNVENYHDPINYLRKNRKGGGGSLIIHKNVRFQKFDKINQLRPDRRKRPKVIFGSEH